MSGASLSGITIRRLSEDDASAFRQIRLETLKAEPSYFGTLLEDEAARTLDDVRRVLAADTVLGAFDGSALAGVMRVHLHTNAKERHKAGLHGVFVRPGHRGRGIGSALLRAAITAAAAAGRERMVLVVAAENTAAIALYERAGFQAFGTEPQARKHEGVYGDLTSMSLRLA